MSAHAEALQAFEAELRNGIAALERELANTVEDLNRYAAMLRDPANEHAVALLASHADRVGGIHRRLRERREVLDSLRAAVERAGEAAR